MNFKRAGFLGAVAGVVALMAAAVVGKSALDAREAAEAKSAPKAAGGGGAVVAAGIVQPRSFSEVIETIGTARARESVTIAAKVTDTIRRIRFESGDRVRKGEILVELASVEQAADLREAEAALEVERSDYKRLAEIGQQGFASTAQLEAARASLSQAEARVEALRSRIGDRVIRAPFAGIVGLRTASPGALVRPGDPIATLDDVSVIKLDFDVAESQIAKLRPGAKISAAAAAFPGERFEGAVDHLDSRVDPATRMLRARALIPNPDGRLKPGMLMTVQALPNERQSPAVPEIAVLERGGESYVLLLEPADGGYRVREQAVKTGLRADGQVEILDGVTAGARFVEEGVQRVRPGQVVGIVGEEPARAEADKQPTKGRL